MLEKILSYGEKFIVECWEVFGQMSPYLLFGFLIAGILSVCISPEWVEKHLGKQGLGSIIKSSLFGVPLPLCSCGVIPVAVSIRRHGASKGATTAFLLSTPQTGVDSMVVTYALLGPVYAIFRPIAAFLTGVFGGIFTDWIENKDFTESSKEKCEDDCCAKSSGSKFRRALEYGFITLPADIGKALLLGIIIAGAISTFFDAGVLGQYLGTGIFSMIAMILFGIPLYICSTASVPIALGFIHMGISPGAALAFLIAGPATNAAAFTTIWKVLGRKTALVYISTAAASAVICGLMLDQLFAYLSTSGMEEICHAGDSEIGFFANACSALMWVVLGYSFLKSRDSSPGKGCADDSCSCEGEAISDEEIMLKITGMTCSHCENSVRKALIECVGVTSVTLESSVASIKGKDFNKEQLINIIRSLGYEAE